MKTILIFVLFVLFSGNLFSQDGWDNWKPYSSESYYEINQNSQDHSLRKKYDIFNPRFYVSKMQNRFLSVDRFAEKYPSLTPYQYAANNPIVFVDINGDSLDILGDGTLGYLRSLVHPDYANRITVDENGRVAFNIEGLNISSDKILQFLNNLINGKGKFLFEIADKTTGIFRVESPEGSAGSTKEIDLNIVGIVNFSITPRNIDGGLGSSGLLPKNGYDGQVSLGPGNFRYPYSNLLQPTTNIVFHELVENYYRTIYKMPYIRADGSGAHKRAIIDAKNFVFQVGPAGKGVYVPR